MKNKIPCGGFYLDDTLNVNDSGELSIKGGTPYQQLVTDGNGNTKWEDRLAYEYVGESELLVEKTLTFTNMGGLQVSLITETFTILAGDTVTVTWDGVPYICIAKDANGGLFVGNSGIAGIGEDTGEPFIITQDGESWGVATADASSTHVISISVRGVKVKKIDAKYLDTPLVEMPLEALTYENAKEILDSGKLPYIQMTSDYNYFKMFPCQDASEYTTYITFASFVSCAWMDSAFARVAYLKLVKNKPSNINDVKVYDLPLSENGKGIIIRSSTSSSTKQFRITVDDTGTISATEVI